MSHDQANARKSPISYVHIGGEPVSAQAAEEQNDLLKEIYPSLIHSVFVNEGECDGAKELIEYFDNGRKPDANAKLHAIIAMQDGKPVGEIMYTTFQHERCAFLPYGSVLPEFRSQGIFKELLTQAQEQITTKMNEEVPIFADVTKSGEKLAPDFTAEEGLAALHKMGMKKLDLNYTLISPPNTPTGDGLDYTQAGHNGSCLGVIYSGDVLPQTVNGFVKAHAKQLFPDIPDIYDLCLKNPNVADMNDKINNHIRLNKCIKKVDMDAPLFTSGHVAKLSEERIRDQHSKNTLPFSKNPLAKAVSHLERITTGNAASAER